MKKKVLLSSVLTILLCLSLIAGSTYALFTSTSELNIAITAGEVDMVAGVSIISVESVEPDAAGTIEDENGAKYSYSYFDGTAPYEFINGGTAELDSAVVTLDRITPGDKVNLEISGANNSDVAVQYRYIIECLDGYKLMSGLNVYVGTEKYEALASYTSPYALIAPGTDMTVVPVTIELPVDAGNEYQKQTTSIRIVVEAVQGNADVADNVNPVVVSIPTAATPTELDAALADESIPAVNLTDDMSLTIGDLSNKIIYANDNEVEFVFNGALDNVVISGIADDGDAVPAVQFDGATGNITIKDSVLFDFNSQPYGAIAGGNADLSVTIEGCKISGARPVYCAGAVKSITLIGCEIFDTSSWAVLENAEVYGDVVIDGCTFDNCVGLFKATRAISGNFTFTNNTIIDCTTKNGFYVDVKVDGDVTVSGNVMKVAGVVADNDVTAADLLGVVKN